MTVTKYTELANEMRKEILSGKYGSEGGIPTSSELSKTYKLALNTVKAALFHLEGEKLIVKRGNNYYVNLASVMMTQFVPLLLVDMAQQGKVAFIRNIGNVERVPLPDHIADIVEVDHGTMSTFRYRVAGEVVDEKEVPGSLASYYYLIPITDNQIRQMQDNPHVDVLAELYPGRMWRYDENSARLPTKEEAKHLGVSELTPVLGLQTVNRDMDGNVLLIQELVSLNTKRKYVYSFDNKPAKG